MSRTIYYQKAGVYIGLFNAFMSVEVMVPARFCMKTFQIYYKDP